MRRSGSKYGDAGYVVLAEGGWAEQGQRDGRERTESADGGHRVRRMRGSVWRHERGRAVDGSSVKVMVGSRRDGRRN